MHERAESFSNFQALEEIFGDGRHEGKERAFPKVLLSTICGDCVCCLYRFPVLFKGSRLNPSLVFSLSTLLSDRTGKLRMLRVYFLVLLPHSRELESSSCHSCILRCEVDALCVVMMRVVFALFLLLTFFFGEGVPWG